MASGQTRPPDWDFLRIDVSIRRQNSWGNRFLDLSQVDWMQGEVLNFV